MCLCTVASEFSFSGLRDFLEAWRIAVLIQEGHQEIEHFFLPFGESHVVLASSDFAANHFTSQF